MGAQKSVFETAAKVGLNTIRILAQYGMPVGNLYSVAVQRNAGVASQQAATKLNWVGILNALCNVSSQVTLNPPHIPSQAVGLHSNSGSAEAVQLHRVANAATKLRQKYPQECQTGSGRLNELIVYHVKAMFGTPDALRKVQAAVAVGIATAKKVYSIRGQKSARFQSALAISTVSMLG